MNQILEKEQYKVYGVPGGIISSQLKNDIIKQRKALLYRSMVNEAKNKKMSEWTIPKMKEIARK